MKIEMLCTFYANSIGYFTHTDIAKYKERKILLFSVSKSQGLSLRIML